VAGALGIRVRTMAEWPMRARMGSNQGLDELNLRQKQAKVWGAAARASAEPKGVVAQIVTRDDEI
jgi:hypothetical protein